MSAKAAFTQSKTSLRLDLNCLPVSLPLTLLLAYLSLSDGSNGLLSECHLEKNESHRAPLSRPAADRRVWTKASQSFSSSSAPVETREDFNGQGVAVSIQDSSHERVRAIDSIGGDLSIKLDFRDISLPV